MGKLDAIVGPILEKYGIPAWVSPFIYDYIKSDPVNVVKRGLSFIDTKRRKGEVTKRQILLPNGYSFSIKSIEGILSAFFYIEDRAAEVVDYWFSMPIGHDYSEYRYYFQSLANVDRKHARAIKNLAEGIGTKIVPAKKEVQEVFDFLQSIELWPERLIASEVILKRAYATFGIVFYKVFYPSSPEFMRSFIKVFRSEELESWESKEVNRIIKEKEITESRLLELSRNLLRLAYKSMYAYIPIAKKERIEKEVSLVINVAIAHPLQFLKEHGVDLDVTKEVKEITMRK
ncbi:MAG: hypothetical protein QXR58_00740 [Candidatus Micrarchaeaceae archaeon]